MPFTATILQVLIASPGDVAEARDAVERAIHAWNGSSGKSAGVIFLPRRWETDAVPELRSDAQSVINTQLVDEADVVIGIFHSRLGRRTERAVSGTAEELERSRQAGKPVHVYFGEMPFPYSTDARQLAQVQRFKSQLSGMGLLGSYTSVPDLETRIRNALDRDAADLRASSPGQPPLPDNAVAAPVASSTVHGRDQRHHQAQPDTTGSPEEGTAQALIDRWLRSPHKREQIREAVDRLLQLEYSLLPGRPRTGASAATYLRVVDADGKTIGSLNSKTFVWHDALDPSAGTGQPVRITWEEPAAVRTALEAIEARQG